MISQYIFKVLIPFSATRLFLQQRLRFLLMNFVERVFGFCISMSLVVITTVDSCGDGVLAPTVRAVSDDCWVVRQESCAAATAAAIIAGAH